eukprot:gnl/MRDRNA2_/MRDRNA2_116444_c0_seq1.p1 gnl/MRDRNA2_/MRDRNA2_116444_c0~~gnl/MRDRNA2_/MRDRNA2_116444_c0_seq1.p1  ORF type:complete len:164 (+),score=10.37 gnl/MRDRNA2_/MRDRNA2_116444_c0_seq1:39-530(+)
MRGFQQRHVEAWGQAHQNLRWRHPHEMALIHLRKNEHRKRGRSQVRDKSQGHEREQAFPLPVFYTSRFSNFSRSVSSPSLHSGGAKDSSVRLVTGEEGTTSHARRKQGRSSDCVDSARPATATRSVLERPVAILPPESSVKRPSSSPASMGYGLWTPWAPRGA